MEKLNTIGAIIVIYNPDLTDFKRNLLKILDLNIFTLIIDNGSSEAVKGLIQKNKRKNLGYISLGTNRGIAYAQNKGIDFFRNRKEQLLLFLDQDSYIDSVNLSKLESVFRSIIKKDDNAVAIGPAQSYDSLDSDVEQCTELISSGSLVKKAAFREIGKYRSDFFIDYVDYEWVWRALQKGFTIYKTRLAEMVHETEGVQRYHGHTVDPIFRLYYIFRNSTYLVLYQKISWRIKLKLIIRNGGKLVFQSLLPNKKDRVKRALIGIHDGMTAKLN